MSEKNGNCYYDIILTAIVQTTAQYYDGRDKIFNSFQIHTIHENLEYFFTQTPLNPWQAPWLQTVCMSDYIYLFLNCQLALIRLIHCQKWVFKCKAVVTPTWTRDIPTVGTLTSTAIIWRYHYIGFYSCCSDNRRAIAVDTCLRNHHPRSEHLTRVRVYHVLNNFVIWQVPWEMPRFLPSTT